MNKFLKKHIVNITDDDYPTKLEYKIIGGQVVKRLTEMGVVLPRNFSVSIITCIMLPECN